MYCPSTHKVRGTNRGGLTVIGSVDIENFFESWPEFVAHNSMFPLCWKINLLWFVYKGWLLPARTCLYNLSLQHPYCLLVLSQSIPRNKRFLLSYFCSDEQFPYIALIFQNDTNVDFFSKFSKFPGFARKFCQSFLQVKVHQLFHLLHESREDQTHSLLWLCLLGFWKER